MNLSFYQLSQFPWHMSRRAPRGCIGYLKRICHKENQVLIFKISMQSILLDQSRTWATGPFNLHQPPNQVDLTLYCLATFRSSYRCLYVSSCLQLLWPHALTGSLRDLNTPFTTSADSEATRKRVSFVRKLIKSLSHHRTHTWEWSVTDAFWFSSITQIVSVISWISCS